MQAEDICRGYGTDDWGPATQREAMMLLGRLWRCKESLLDNEDKQLVLMLDELCLKKIPTATIPELLAYPGFSRWAFRLGAAYASDEEDEEVLFGLFQDMDDAGLLLWYAIKRRDPSDYASVAVYRTRLADAVWLFNGRAGMWGIVEERLRTWYETIDTETVVGEMTADRFQKVFAACREMDADI